MRKTVLAAICVIAAAGITAGALFAFRGQPRSLPHHHAAASAPSPAAIAPASTCTALSTSPKPLVTYALLVIQGTGRLGGLNPTPADGRKATAELAGRVRQSCPQFAYLIAQYASTH